MKKIYSLHFILFILLLYLAQAVYSQEPQKDTIPGKVKKFEYLLFTPKTLEYSPDSIPEFDTLFLYEFYDMSLEELDSIKAMGVSSELEKFINSLMSVSTTRSLSTRDNPAIVTLITEEEIKNSGARDLIDVLRLVPGFFFAQDDFGQVGIGIRGNWANEGKLLLMVDGVQMNENFLARLYFGNHYSVYNIKRIEIIRGPGSAIYGGYAEFSAINIITKKPEDFKGISVSADVGTFDNGFARNNWSLYAGQQWNETSLKFSIDGGYGNRSDQDYWGFYDNIYYQDSVGVGDYASLANDSDLKNFNSYLYLKHKGLEFKQIINLNRFTDVTTIDTNLKHPVQYGITSSHSELKYKFKLLDHLSITPKIDFTIMRPWYKKSDYYGQITSGNPNSNMRRIRANVLIDYDINHRTNFLGGAEVYNDVANEGDSISVFYIADSNIRITNAAFFGQVIFKVPIANFILGARYEYNSEFKHSFVPRLGVTKKIKNFHFKFLVSGAFKVPTIGNYYRSFDGTFTVNEDSTEITSIGRGIEPERTMVVEAEAGYQITSNIIVTANFFDYTISDPIVFSFIQTEEIRDLFGPFAGISAYQNYDRAGSRGFELDFKIKDRWGYFYLNYSFYSVKNKPRIAPYAVSTFNRDPQLRQEVRNDLLLGFPKHKLNLNVCYYINRNFSVNLTASAYSERYGFDVLQGGDIYDEDGNLIIPAKFNVNGQLIEKAPTMLTNIFIRHQNLFTKGLTAGVGVYDIFNQKFEYLQPYFGLRPPMPGPSREYYFNITYDFPFSGSKKKNK